MADSLGYLLYMNYCSKCKHWKDDLSEEPCKTCSAVFGKDDIFVPTMWEGVE